MSDPITRDELAAELRATKAEATSQFKEILGEIRTSNAELAGKIELASAKAAGKWTVWGAAGSVVIAVIGILIALSQVAQTGYDTGAEGEKRIAEAIKAAQPPKFDAQTGKPIPQ